MPKYRALADVQYKGMHFAGEVFVTGPEYMPSKYVELVEDDKPVAPSPLKSDELVKPVVPKKPTGNKSVLP